ncbi:sulfurtransferase [Terrilactibacillus laevilacticus]|uniref:Sulfurtransferase n=1 Tax=Terrilactibacillus laevilacticus TaxID=1380157 RepID=A0ABW5PQI1_9BACI|nr:sulfurtransferase [Terrilactibacillus laevilacticus]
MNSIISMDQVNRRLGHENYVFVDCRFNLQNPDEGQNQYHEGHLPGAIFFDLEKDLSADVSEHGGRHPLPNEEEFVKKLGKCGIDGTKTVIAYDDQDGAMAAHLWWLLQYYGHPNVQIMDEGFTAWKEKGYPIEQKMSLAKETHFIPHIHPDWVLTMSDVKALDVSKGDTILIDSRAPERFSGKVETVDKKSGHIPGAVNWFWKDNRSEQGKWKTAEELKSRFEPLKQKDQIVVYCGSGVTACGNIIAMKEAGLKNIKLYSGSWSDWISYENNPIETEE